MALQEFQCFHRKTQIFNMHVHIKVSLTEEIFIISKRGINSLRQKKRIKLFYKTATYLMRYKTEGIRITRNLLILKRKKIWKFTNNTFSIKIIATPCFISWNRQNLHSPILVTHKTAIICFNMHVFKIKFLLIFFIYIHFMFKYVNNLFRNPLIDSKQNLHSTSLS